MKQWPSAKRALSGLDPWDGPCSRAYYSGFFGAHGLLRAIGRGIIYIEAAVAGTLSEIGQIFCGEDFQVRAGNFAMSIQQDVSGQLIVTLTRLPSDRGAHQQFWRRFKLDLSAIVEEVSLLNEPEENLVVARTAELQALLDGQGLAGTWLSAMRNQVNYQQQHRVWFPFGAPQRDVTYVASIGYKSSETARLDYDPVGQPVQAFAAASLYLAAICYEVSDQLIRGSVARGGVLRSRWLRLTTDLASEISPVRN